MIFLDDYPEEVLRQFIGSYSGKVKKGVKNAVRIFEYSAAAFWKAFRGYADHAGYPMKSACVTTSPAHPAASSEQMPFLQQLPSFGYMLVSNKSGVQQHGCDLDSSRESRSSSHDVQQHEEERRWNYDGVDGLASYTFKEFLDKYGSEANKRWFAAAQVQQQVERRWDYDGVGSLAPYTFKEFRDEYGSEAIERWFAALP